MANMDNDLIRMLKEFRTPINKRGTKTNVAKRNKEVQKNQREVKKEPEDEATAASGEHYAKCDASQQTTKVIKTEIEEKPIIPRSPQNRQREGDRPIVKVKEEPGTSSEYTGCETTSAMDIPGNTQNEAIHRSQNQQSRAKLKEEVETSFETETTPVLTANSNNESAEPSPEEARNVGPPRFAVNRSRVSSTATTSFRSVPRHGGSTCGTSTIGQPIPVLNPLVTTTCSNAYDSAVLAHAMAQLSTPVPLMALAPSLSPVKHLNSIQPLLPYYASPAPAPLMGLATPSTSYTLNPIDNTPRPLIDPRRVIKPLIPTNMRGPTAKPSALAYEPPQAVRAPPSINTPRPGSSTPGQAQATCPKGKSKTSGTPSSSKVQSPDPTTQKTSKAIRRGAKKSKFHRFKKKSKVSTNSSHPDHILPAANTPRTAVNPVATPKPSRPKPKPKPQASNPAHAPGPAVAPPEAAPGLSKTQKRNARRRALLRARLAEETLAQPPVKRFAEARPLSCAWCNIMLLGLFCHQCGREAGAANARGRGRT